MKKELELQGLGTLVYEESMLTGRKKIFVNGEETNKIDKRSYDYKGTLLKLEGNFLLGVNVVYREEKYQVVEKTKWYEYILAVLAFIFDVVWGNVSALCQLFPIVGGAVGGAICGAMVVVQICVMRVVKKPLYKVLISLLLSAVTIAICYGVAMLMLTLA